MFDVKVVVTDVKDLIKLHRIMEDETDCNFDVVAGSISVDGKSLLGVLGLSRRQFTIKVQGDESSFLPYREKIIDYIEN